MQVKTTWFRCGVIAMFCTVCLLGWPGMQTSQAGDHETVLLDSGFKKWSADSPKQKALFKTVPPDKIVTYKRKDQTVQVYSHPQSGSLYVGDDQAHQNYLKKTKEKRITSKERRDADTPNDPEFWQMWEDSQGGG
jgi:hypothetical protein